MTPRTGLYVALVGLVMAVVCLARAPAEKTKPAATENAPVAALQEKLEFYVGRLKHGSVEKRREAVLALGRIGERAKAAEAAVPALTDALKGGIASGRVYPAEVMRKIKKDPAAVAAMIADLKDTDLQVRLAAASALGRFGVEAKAAVPALVEAVNDAAPIVRSSAALALWQINKHPDVIPALIEDLKGDRESSARRYCAAGALGQIGVEAKAAVPALVEALEDHPWTLGEIPVALALWQIDKHPAAVPVLVECLKERDGSRRMWAADTLGIIGVDAKAAVPALAEALEDQKSFVRRSAAEALGAMGAEAKAAVPALIEALEDQKSKEIKPAPGAAKGYLGLVSVLRALHGEPYIDQIGAGSPADKSGLESGDTIIGVNDTRITDIKQLRVALEKLTLKPGDQVTFAINRGDAKPMRVAVTASEWPKSDERKVLPGFVRARVSAAEALWKINKHPAAVPALAEALKDPEDGSWAGDALRRIAVEGKAAVAALVEVLEDEDEGVRNSAAKWLEKIDPEAAKKAGEDKSRAR